MVEANSDSDDEDKLHIVEEESITDAADCEGGVPDDELPTDQTVLPGGSDRGGSAKNCWQDDVFSLNFQLAIGRNSHLKT